MRTKCSARPETKGLYLDTSRASFYLHYTIEMITFNKVKKKLWEKNLEYSSTYPTKLWLWHEVFPPSEVEPFLSSVEEAYSKPLLHMMM